MDNESTKVIRDQLRPIVEQAVGSGKTIATKDDIKERLVKMSGCEVTDTLTQICYEVVKALNIQSEEALEPTLTIALLAIGVTFCEMC